MYSLDKLEFLQQITELVIGKQFHRYIMSLDYLPKNRKEIYSKFMKEYFDITTVPIDLIIYYLDKTFTIGDVSAAKVEKEHDEDGRLLLHLTIDDTKGSFFFYLDELLNDQESILFDVIKCKLIIPAIKNIMSTNTNLHIN